MLARQLPCFQTERPGACLSIELPGFGFWKLISDQVSGFWHLPSVTLIKRPLKARKSQDPDPRITVGYICEMLRLQGELDSVLQMHMPALMLWGTGDQVVTEAGHQMVLDRNEPKQGWMENTGGGKLAVGSLFSIWCLWEVVAQPSLLALRVLRRLGRRMDIASKDSSIVAGFWPLAVFHSWLVVAQPIHKDFTHFSLKWGKAQQNTNLTCLHPTPSHKIHLTQNTSIAGCLQPPGVRVPQVPGGLPQPPGRAPAEGVGDAGHPWLAPKSRSSRWRRMIWHALVADDACGAGEWQGFPFCPWRFEAI